MGQVKLDLDEIRKRQARLKGEGTGGGNRKNLFFFPEEGISKVRLLPWQDHPGNPFKEIWYYYTLCGYTEYKGKRQKGKAPMALRQFGVDDPIQERIQILRSKEKEDGTEKTEEEHAEDLEFCKKLYPTQTIYMPVIVRGKENEGPKLWSFSGRKVYERMCELLLKDNVGQAIMDTGEKGCDIEITVKFNPAQEGNLGKSTGVDPDLFNISALTENEEQLEAWMKEIPDPLKLMAKRRITYEELEKRFDDWMAEGSEDDNSDGTSRGGDTEEAPTETASEEPAPKKKTRKNKPKTKPMKDIADAFGEVAGSADE